MSQVLLITSSPRRADSLSSRFAIEIAKGILARKGGTPTVRDLAYATLPHITAEYTAGRDTAAESRTPAQAAAVDIAQELVDELKLADFIVLGSSLINFGLPSSLET